MTVFFKSLWCTRVILHFSNKHTFLSVVLEKQFFGTTYNFGILDFCEGYGTSFAVSLTMREILEKFIGVDKTCTCVRDCSLFVYVGRLSFVLVMKFMKKQFTYIFQYPNVRVESFIIGSLFLQRLLTIQIITIAIIRIKNMLAIPTQAIKKRIKVRIIIKIRRMKNHRKNENGNKKRKKHRRIKIPVTQKVNQAYL